MEERRRRKRKRKRHGQTGEERMGKEKFREGGRSDEECARRQQKR